MILSTSEIDSIVSDVESRLQARENGQNFRTDRAHVYFSPANVLYVPVFGDDSSPGGVDRIMDTLSAVEQETSTRFNIEVLVLPAAKLDSNGHA